MDYHPRPGMQHDFTFVTGQDNLLPSVKCTEMVGPLTDFKLAQVLLPFVQGTVWTLALSGWRYWNRNASLSGQTLGSRIRRWWYEVNNWKVPPRLTNDPRVAAQVEEVSGVFRTVPLSMHIARDKI